MIKIYKILAVALGAFLIFGCAGKSPSSRTPTETIKALSEAGKKKDVPTIKSLLSKESWKLYEDAAKNQNTTTEKLLTREGGAPFQNLTEYGKENIQNETATVEVKTELTEDFERIPLVREDGEWKAALDVYIKDLQKRLTEQMRTVDQNNSNTANTNQPKTNSSPVNK